MADENLNLVEAGQPEDQPSRPSGFPEGVLNGAINLDEQTTRTLNGAFIFDPVGLEQKDVAGLQTRLGGIEESVTTETNGRIKAVSRVEASLSEQVQSLTKTDVENLKSAKEYTDTAINNLVDGAPDALNTLKEISLSLNNETDAVNSLIKQIGQETKNREAADTKLSDADTALDKKLSKSIEDESANRKTAIEELTEKTGERIQQEVKERKSADDKIKEFIGIETTGGYHQGLWSNYEKAIDDASENVSGLNGKITALQSDIDAVYSLMKTATWEEAYTLEFGENTIEISSASQAEQLLVDIQAGIESLVTEIGKLTQDKETTISTVASFDGIENMGFPAVINGIEYATPDDAQAALVMAQGTLLSIESDLGAAQNKMTLANGYLTILTDFMNDPATDYIIPHSISLNHYGNQEFHTFNEAEAFWNNAGKEKSKLVDILASSEKFVNEFTPANDLNFKAWLTFVESTTRESYDADLKDSLSKNIDKTIAYVNDSFTKLVNAAPETLDQINELAIAIGEDPNFSVTVAKNLADAKSEFGKELNAEVEARKKAVGEVQDGLDKEITNRIAAISNLEGQLSSKVSDLLKNVNIPKIDSFFEVLQTINTLMSENFDSCYAKVVDSSYVAPSDLEVYGKVVLSVPVMDGSLQLFVNGVKVKTSVYTVNKNAEGKIESVTLNESLTGTLNNATSQFETYGVYGTVNKADMSGYEDVVRDPNTVTDAREGEGR